MVWRVTARRLVICIHRQLMQAMAAMKGKLDNKFYMLAEPGLRYQIKTKS